ncbi:MAG: hypothetical protein ACRDGF_07905 [Chloroflexota bacterium]
MNSVGRVHSRGGTAYGPRQYTPTGSGSLSKVQRDLGEMRQYLGARRRLRPPTPPSGFDAQIAAICRARGAALATRNVANFDGTGVEIIDPWLRPSLEQ